MSLKNLNDFDNSVVIEEENIIIGSGAGGSTIAYELLKKGKKSIILEEGPNIADIKSSNIGFNISNLYKNNGATPMLSLNGGPLIGYGQGSCVGGSTYVNAGYFSNTSEQVYSKLIHSKKTLITFKEFQSLINEIKEEIKINCENLNDEDRDNKYLLDRAKNLNFKIDKCERFSTGIEGIEKQNMNSTYHKEILKNDLDIIFNCKVEKIVTNLDYATSIIATDKLLKKKVYFKFKNLFVNCGPINTPHLLKKNNIIENKSRNFEFHINFKIVVKFKHEINFNLENKFDPNRAISKYFMREFANDGTLLSVANNELSYMLATCSHFNDEIIKDIFLNQKKYSMFIYQIKSNSKGSIKSFFGKPFVEYSFSNKDYQEIRKAIKRISNFFLGHDIEFILFPLENSKPIKNVESSNFLSENINPKKLQLVSVHGMSSLRSGPDNCETDYYGKLKKFKNIFVSDASILPGNTGESPQASIMAYAKFVGKNII